MNNKKTMKDALWINIRKQDYTLVIRGLKISLTWDELKLVFESLRGELINGIQSSIEKIIDEIIDDYNICLNFDDLSKIIGKKLMVDYD